ncbi:MAG: 50S ribosomal protein L35ae [Candidatus Diapherotrites archaeon]
MMQGILKNYRRGKNTQHPTQYVVEVEGIDSRAKAHSLAGKKVTWKSVANKVITGKIMAAHGNSGAVRVKFDKGLPGQAIGGSVTISA